MKPRRKVTIQNAIPAGARIKPPIKINRCMTIHLHSNIITTVNAIDAKEIEPIVDYSSYLLLLDTSNKELGNLRFTRFLKETLAPIDSYEVRYSTYHTVGQVLMTPIAPRFKFDEPIHSELPGHYPKPPPNGTIIPGCY